MPARSHPGPPDPARIDEAVPLSSLGRGCQAMVHRCMMTGDDGELLAAMGLSDRCPLRVCRAGEPCIVQVATTRLALSAAMARKVLVVPVDRTDAATGPTQ